MTSSLVFICGFPSGGTDLTRTILNAHPDIHINGEMPLLINIARLGYPPERRFDQLADIHAFQDVLRSLDIWGNIENLAHDFQPMLELQGSLSMLEVLRVCFSSNTRPIWGNKTPQNTENIGQLAQLFPQAKFLVVTRDVRDVCLSWHDKWGKDMLLCAEKWTRRMRDGWEMSAALPPNRVLWIKYEAWLNDLEAVAREVCAFLGIEFSAQMLEYHRYVDGIIDGKVNYGQPLKQDNQGKWKRRLSSRMILRIEQISYPTLQLLGYSPTLAVAHRPLSRLQITRGKLGDLLAMIWVGNRASANNTLRQRLASLAFELKKRQAD